MAWRKAPEELVELFHEIVPQEPLANHRKMFGYPSCFVNGNLFSGLHQENMIMRLSETDREEFLKIEGASLFEPMPGRVMREYVCAPTAMFSDKQELFNWMKRSFEYASGLPEKKRKKRKNGPTPVQVPGE